MTRPAWITTDQTAIDHENIQVDGGTTMRQQNPLAAMENAAFPGDMVFSLVRHASRAARASMAPAMAREARRAKVIPIRS